MKRTILAFLLLAALPAMAETALTDPIDPNADTCVWALDARPELELPTATDHSCRYVMPALPVGQHSVKVKARSKAHPELWEDSVYTAPKDFAVRGTLLAPDGLRVQ